MYVHKILSVQLNRPYATRLESKMSTISREYSVDGMSNFIGWFAQIIRRLLEFPDVMRN